MSKCFVCNKEMTPKIINVETKWGDSKTLTIPNIPAEVCECGEILFDCEVVDYLQSEAEKKVKFAEAKDNLWNKIVKTFRIIEIVEWIEKKLGGWK